MKLKTIITFFFIFLALSSAPSVSHAYPNTEVAQLSFTDVTAQAVQMALTTDNRYLYLGFGIRVKIIDLAGFTLASTQPYDFGAHSEFTGAVGGIVLSSSFLYVALDNGKMLRFDRNDLTAEPTSITIASGVRLGKMAINSAETRLYIVDKDEAKIFVYTIATATTSTILLNPTISGASINDMILAPTVSGGYDYIYIATNKGLMFYILDGQTTVYPSTVAHNTDNLLAIAAKPSKDYIYVIDSSDKQVLVLSALNLTLFQTVDLIIETGTNPIYNESPTGILSTAVTNPSSNYTFVSGIEGVSVMGSDNVLINVNAAATYEFSPIPITGERYGPMVASTDGYIYMSNSNGSISLITANPYIDPLTVTYSDGASALTLTNTATLTFRSSKSGTYDVRVGGSITKTGTLLVDTSGSSGGSVTAATDTAFTLNYTANSAHLDEGANSVFVFVTDSTSDLGRGLTTLTVDTPPPAVTVTSTGFGTNRLYVNFNRLTQSDISYYNVYVDTDADAVANRTVTPTRISQPSSGSSVAAQIGGLTNNVLYYAGVEAIDAAGNVGPYTITLPDGSRITGIPEQSIGPAELTGEKGCSLIVSQCRSVGVLECRSAGVFKCWGVIFVMLLVMVLICRKFKVNGRSSLRAAISRVIVAPSFAKSTAGRGTPLLPLTHKNYRRWFLFVLMLFLLASFLPKLALADEGVSPKWWSTELKGGFWFPMNSDMKKFFGPCCHLTGMVEQGFLYKSKYGAEVGVGVLSETGRAIGARSGAQSQDSFNLFLLPIETAFVFRADFKEDQMFVPYAKAGVDYVFFRENMQGQKTKGMKYGLHGVLGLQILISSIDSGSQYAMEHDYGINDIYFTIEGRYNWINSFGAKGLNLSSINALFGLLFEY